MEIVRKAECGKKGRKESQREEVAASSVWKNI